MLYSYSISWLANIFSMATFDFDPLPESAYCSIDDLISCRDHFLHPACCLASHGIATPGDDVGAGIVLLVLMCMICFVKSFVVRPGMLSYFCFWWRVLSFDLAIWFDLCDPWIRPHFMQSSCENCWVKRTPAPWRHLRMRSLEIVHRQGKAGMANWWNE